LVARGFNRGVQGGDPMSGTLLLPDLEDPDSHPFWEGASKGELRIQHCADCARPRMPPRPMCPWCNSLGFVWRTMSGRGTIWSFVVAHPPLLPAYAELAPYNVVTIALDEDPSLRLVGNLVASPQGRIHEVDPASIQIGAPVQVVFQQVEDVYLPRWMPVRST
jgi:hypothetical protein